MRMISIAAVAVLAGAAACRPQAPGSPSARGEYAVAVENSGAQSCYLRYQKRRELPVTEVGYVLAGEKLGFTVTDPDSRSLTLSAVCGGQGYTRLMRLVPGDTLKLEVPSMFRLVQARPLNDREAAFREAEAAAARTRPAGPNREPAPQRTDKP